MLVLIFRTITDIIPLRLSSGGSMKIECHPAENGHREVLAISNPKISQMIRSLAIADEEHHQTLRTFAHQRAAEFD